MQTFERWTRERLGALLRTATAITGDPHLAEEIVQDVLVKASRHWEEISRKDQPDAYVRRMLVNEYVSWRRKWARLVPSARIELDDLHEPEPDLAERSADRDLLDRELRRLPRRQQVVLALRYLDGLDDADIAAALGCTESTVRGHASRGLAALRVSLAAPVPGGTR